MILFTIIFATANSYNYTFDYSNGVLFQENEPLWTYDADIPVRVNVLLDSPREKFRRALNADCGEDYLLESKPTNFFGRNGTDFNETTEDCLLGFRTFDEVIKSFMGEDLTISWRHKLDSSDRKSFNLFKNAYPEDPLTYEEYLKNGLPKNPVRPRQLFSSFKEAYPNDPLTYEEYLKKGLPKNPVQTRNRRAAMAGGAVIGGVAIAGSYVYTGVVDAKSRARDAVLAAEIELERRRIEKLEEVVETVNDKIDEAVKRIRKAKRPIVSYGGLTIPNDAKAVERILEGADAEINQYFASQSAAMGEDIVESILTLMNHRLPLNPVFLDTIKAQCIVYQTVPEEQARKFCNAFAFHTTRWDTRLRFVGLGLTTWPRKDGNAQGKDDLEIRQTQEIDNTKCGYFEDSTRAFVSIRQPGIAQWFHHHPSESVNKVDSFKRTHFAGALNCGPQILRISAIIPGTREVDSVMTYIQPIQVRMRTVQDDEMDEMNARIAKNLHTVKEMGNTMIEMNLTTLELMKRTAATESRNAAETAKEYLYKKFIAPIMGTLGTLSSIVLITLAIYIIIKCNSRRRRRHETPKEYALDLQFAEMNKIAQTNRSTDTL
ncbi:Oidioi.mRNA.OKI2018_I69.PAR.g9756.t1.cds [Oikopleura dioica]|uniref:Oidioi.mRNA.OKI2018_I69.PAR.g9756.t1.cds n=1 Tax=Oikopleura dioica TaxID=34765 RepID=A0ABN7RQR7_OIKDI|nr:Oidioi.mRNA.OKI2018_I69.PAR.g9756.t1.cds [Oikopleura dioica]